MTTKNENTENLDPDQSKNGDKVSNLIDNPVTESENQLAANVDTIGADLISSMPEVQQHAIDQEISNQADFDSKFAHLVDKNGASFNPKIHKTKKDGSPTISKTGKLMLKPNAPKETTTKTADASITQISSQSEPKLKKPELTETEKQQCVALGKVSANMIFACGRMLGGDEWQPIKQNGYDEAAAMEQAFADYYIASGKTEMSPATALGMALTSYALPRFTMPQTKAKSSSFVKKVFAWWNNRKGAKEERARLKAEQARKSAEKKDTTFEA